MNPVILARKCNEWNLEKEFAVSNFDTYYSRTIVPENSLVIARYSCLPFYKELETDLEFKQSKLINSYQEHLYIADIQNWYYDLEKYTPKTYFRLESIPENGPFILKGETNSKKFNWNTHMFAFNKTEAIEVHGRLLNDGLIGSQNIYIRKYEKLFTYFYSINGLPITKEFRFFCYKDQVICGAFYWEGMWDDSAMPNPEEVPKEFLNEITSIISKNTNAYVIDVAQKEDGNWTLIEINDLQMSGLSGNDPKIFYSELKFALEHE